MNRRDRRQYWKRNHNRERLGSWSEYMETQIVHRPRVMTKKEIDELFPAKIETENLEAK